MGTTANERGRHGDLPAGGLLEEETALSAPVSRRSPPNDPMACGISAFRSVVHTESPHPGNLSLLDNHKLQDTTKLISFMHAKDSVAPALYVWYNLRPCETYSKTEELREYMTIKTVP